MNPNLESINIVWAAIELLRDHIHSSVRRVIRKTDYLSTHYAISVQLIHELVPTLSIKTVKKLSCVEIN